MWFVVMLIPALAVLAFHELLLASCQRTAIWRVSRRVDKALADGDEPSLSQAVAEASEALRDWPSSELWELARAVEIALRRLRPAS